MASTNGLITAGNLRLDLAQVADLYYEGEKYRNDARLLEEQGKRVVAHNFPDRESLAFMDAVITWGKGHRFRSRAREKNKQSEVAAALREGHAEAAAGQVAEGVDRVARLRFIGQSFASKHMRILLPRQAVTMDSVIRDQGGYKQTQIDYERFLDACHRALDSIRASTLVPENLRASMRVCDVEMVFFASAKRLQRSQSRRRVAC